MPKKRKSSLSVKHLAEKRRKDRGESSQLSREQTRIRIENYRAGQESEEVRDERRHSARINTSRLRDLRSRTVTEQAVPPPPEPTQK
jgi:hypothetical protein